MITLIISITTIYLILILSFSYGIKKNKEFKEQKKPAIRSFSIIIPFRNEATNLQELLNSLLQLNYAKNKFECNFVMMILQILPQKLFTNIFLKLSLATQL